MRLIDADALDTRERGNNSQRTMWWHIKNLIDKAPTIDAASVVLCKDCKHYWKNVNTPGYSGKCVTASDDFFCAYGERGDG